MKNKSRNISMSSESTSLKSANYRKKTELSNKIATYKNSRLFTTIKSN